MDGTRKILGFLSKETHVVMRGITRCQKLKYSCSYSFSQKSLLLKISIFIVSIETISFNAEIDFCGVFRLTFFQLQEMQIIKILTTGQRLYKNDKHMTKSLIY